MRLAWSAPLLAALVLSAPRAAAQPQPAEFTNEQFVTGKERYDKGDYAGALALFQVVVEQTGSPNARLYVARCQRELGRTLEAHGEMAIALKDAAKKAESEARYANTRDAAASELALLELRVGKLVVTVEESAPGKVTLDGDELAPSRLGTVIALEPGAHELVLSAEGRPPVERDVSLGAGETKAVTLLFPREAGSSAPGPVVVRSDGMVRTIGFIHGGVGVAGMIVFTAFAVAADSKVSTLEEECGEDVRCVDPSYGDTIDEGRTFATVANVGLVVGIVGLASGAVMVALGGPDEEPAAPAKAALVLQPLAGGGALGLRASF